MGKLASDSDVAVDDNYYRSVHEVLELTNNLQNFATVTNGLLAGKHMHITGH